MIKVKNYIKSYILYFIILFIFLLILSLLNYLDILSYNTINIISYLGSLIMFFILGFSISIKECKKGYLNGFIIALLLVIFYILISLFISKLNFSSLVYYLSLITSSILGGIIGVYRK